MDSIGNLFLFYPPRCRYNEIAKLDLNLTRQKAGQGENIMLDRTFVFYDLPGTGKIMAIVPAVYFKYVYVYTICASVSTGK